MTLSLPKHSGSIAVATIIIVLLAWGFWPQPVVVELMASKRAPMTVTIEEEGSTRVIDRYVISAPVDGVACRVQLDIGDNVEQGQTLLTISPLESQVLDARSRAQAQSRVAAAASALQSARQNTESSRAKSVFHQNELQRTRTLADKGLVSKGALDRAETDLLTSDAALRSARHLVEVAKYELEAAETALKYTAGSTNENPPVKIPVRSPINGRILKLHRECEGPVRTGEALLEVGDPASLEVVVDALSIDAVKMRQGTKVLFDRWGGDQMLEGIVRTVEPVGFTKISALGVEEQRVLVIADFVSPHQTWRRLGDAYRVEAHFILWQGEDVLQVPATSLFRYKDGWAVFVMEGGRANRRVVTTGHRNSVSVQIMKGLEEGEMVIDHPSDEVEENRRVAQR